MEFVAYVCPKIEVKPEYDLVITWEYITRFGWKLESSENLAF